MPIPAIRRKVEEIAAGSALWDKRVVAVQVTDFRETTMEVRILASATSAPRVFDLRCEIREKLIEFVQRQYPASLPRVRTEAGASANDAVATEVLRHAAVQN